MKPKLKKKWLEALRGGEYKQGSDKLRFRGKFCCLGVLCDIQGFDWEKIKGEDLITSLLPEGYESGLNAEITTILANMNDGSCGYDKHSFQQIAEYIEENM